jgi:hypothetical protein
MKNAAMMKRRQDVFNSSLPHSSFIISSMKQQRKTMSHERRVLLMALASGLPAMLLALVFLWTGDYTLKACWTLTVLLVGC